MRRSQLGILPLAISTLILLSPSVVRSQIRNPDSFVKFRGVEYCERSREGKSEKLLCDVYVPAGEGPFPAVLCVHGGAWRLGSKEHMVHVAKKLVARDYVAVAINYRLAPEHKFPAQQEDCHDALRWMKDNATKYKIDPQRIAALGYSAGAQMVALEALLENSPDEQEPTDEAEENAPVCVRAVVAGGTPCDFRNLPAGSKALAYWLGGTRREFPDRYADASPANFVSADAPPIFFFHGERDALVPLAGVQTMTDELQQAGGVAELYLVPESGHISAYFNSEAYDRAIGFLDKHMTAADNDSRRAE